MLGGTLREGWGLALRGVKGCLKVPGLTLLLVLLMGQDLAHLLLELGECVEAGWGGLKRGEGWLAWVVGLVLGLTWSLAGEPDGRGPLGGLVVLVSLLVVLLLWRGLGPLGWLSGRATLVHGWVIG